MGKKDKPSSDDVAMEDAERAEKTRNRIPEEDSDIEDSQNAGNHFLSPIAEPLIDGKMLERALKLLKKTVSHEQSVKEDGKKSKGSGRQLKRGVAEVTKSLRKGQKGVVLMASDVHPVDIIAHLPVFCEDKGVLYCFIGTKRLLGGACKTKRPASVIMVCQPTADMPNHEAYEKFSEGLKKVHPYF